MEHVVQTVQETRPGLMFYFVYKVFSGGTNIQHEIECDYDAPETLVISATPAGSHEVSIVVGPDDKREWVAAHIVSLKFGYRREVL